MLLQMAEQQKLPQCGFSPVKFKAAVKSTTTKPLWAELLNFLSMEWP